MILKRIDGLNFRMKKAEAINVIVFLIVLSLAVMSDILRIPRTSITLFRVSIPIVLAIIMFAYPVWFRRLVAGILFFVVINTIFNAIFYKLYRLDLTFNFMQYLRYTLLYLQIFVVIILVILLKEILGEKFKEIFLNWLFIMGGILAAILLLNYICPPFFESLPIDNVNNYGCYLAAIFPFYLLEWGEKKRNVKYIIAIMLVLGLIVLSDAKTALFGVLFQIAIYICLLSVNTKASFIFHRIMLPMGVAAVALLVLLLNPSLNGYYLQDIVGEPILRILNNNPYLTYTASVSFRTNTTLFAFKELWSLKGIGMGAGNMGTLLKAEFPNINSEYIQAKNSTTLSLHNSWLEFMTDFGIIGIIILLIPFVYALKLYFGKAVLSSIEKVYIIFVFSFPIWIMGPSGIYTQYFLFCVIAYLVIRIKDLKYKTG